MKTLLRFYLVLIFVSSAFDAGSANDSVNSENTKEASNFASYPSNQQNLNKVAICISASDLKESEKVVGSITVGNFSE